MSYLNQRPGPQLRSYDSGVSVCTEGHGVAAQGAGKSLSLGCWAMVMLTLLESVDNMTEAKQFYCLRETRV